MTWNTQQRRLRLLLAVAVLACGVALLRPVTAHAGYPLETSARVALGFGASYRAADATATSTHHGTDLAAEPGARLVAPFAGRVTFIGRVPAVGGGTVRELTIATARGAVTLLPFADVSVAKGDTVAEGQPLGSLSENGDGSSAGTHLHVGVKRGDLYIDPLSVLSLPAVAPSAGGGADATGAQGVAHAAKATGARATAPHHTAQGVRTLSGSAAAASVQTGARAVRTPEPGAVVAPGVTIAGCAPIAAQAAPSGVAGPLARLRGPGVALPAPAAHAVSADASLALADLLARMSAAAVAGGRLLILGILGSLAGLGLLWPLWRRGERKGTGEDHVSALGDDVAAVVGR